MFYNKKDMSYLNHWAEWAIKGAEREELFQDVRQLVEDMVKEIVPQILDEYLKDYTVNVETRLNGRAANLDGLRADMERLIKDELTKGIR